ncbi:MULTISPECIES: DUF6364 family protein [Salinibacter]|uniref:DUF6364 family protein n=1 Tax=Salinibacter TaxID=146918 RepID=UPI001ABB584C|nr:MULTISPECIES: DUF6364 family protein [Salinibacter]
MSTKSKLTLRLDDRLKERAKRLAKERGTSVSQIVEDYFRLLLREPNGDDSGPESASDMNTVPDDLPPRTRKMVDALGPAATDLNLDKDTEAWVDAMHEKHK